MIEIMTREASAGDLKELVQKFVPEAMGREIEKASRGIYPLANVLVRKCKSASCLSLSLPIYTSPVLSLQLEASAYHPSPFSFANVQSSRLPSTTLRNCSRPTPSERTRLARRSLLESSRSPRSSTPSKLFVFLSPYETIL